MALITKILLFLAITHLIISFEYLKDRNWLASLFYLLMATGVLALI